MSNKEKLTERWTQGRISDPEQHRHQHDGL